MTESFVVEEVFVAGGNFAALSIGFASQDDPLDVLHIVADTANTQPSELHLERTDQSLSCVNELRMIECDGQKIKLHLSDNGAKILGFKSVVELTFDKHPNLLFDALDQLEIIAAAASVAISKT